MSESAGYLPPLVTKLKGDISDLKAAFATSIADAKVWATTMRRELTAEMKITAHQTAEIFHKGTRETFDRFGDDVIRDAAGDTFAKAGQAAAQTFGGGFSSTAAGSGPYGMAAIVTLALGAAVFLAPAIGAAIGAALTIGLGVGFIGLGAFLLKDDKTVIKKAHHLGDTIKKVFEDSARPMKAPFLESLSIFERGVLKLGPFLKLAFKNLGPVMPDLAKGVTDSILALAPGLTEALGNSGPLISTMAKELPGIFRSIGNLLADVSENGPALTRFLQDGSKFAIFLIDGLGGVIVWLTDAYLTMATFADDTKTNFGEAKVAVSNWAGGVNEDIDKVIAWIDLIPGKVQNGIDRFPEIMSGTAERAFDDMNRAIGRGVGIGIKGIRELPDRAWTAMTDLADNLDQGARDAVHALIVQLTWIVPAGKKKFNEFNLEVKKVLWNAPGLLYQAGKDMLSGLVSGVASSLGWAIGKVKDAMRGIYQGAKDALGIHSPSTVFAELGMYSVQGYAQGVNANAATAWAAWAGILQPRGAGRPNIGGPAMTADGLAAAQPRGGYGPASGGGTMVATTINIDGQAFVTAVTPAVQRANDRNNRPVFGNPRTGGATA